MEKSITKGQNFDSFAEFDKVFKTYCDKTHQVYNKRSCRQLKIEDIRTGTIEEKELIKNKIVYKDIVYNCVHKGECRNNPNKKGDRVNVLSKKIECEATIRVNFILKSQTFLITQIETNHNHPLNEDIYQQYSNVRKPSEKDLTQMVDMVNLGASVNKVVRQFNNEKDKALKVKDVWNQKRKLEKEYNEKELDRLEEILDTLSKNKNNTISTKRSDDGILENAFIMTEEQKK